MWLVKCNFPLTVEKAKWQGDESSDPKTPRDEVVPIVFLRVPVKVTVQEAAICDNTQLAQGLKRKWTNERSWLALSTGRKDRDKL